MMIRCLLSIASTVFCAFAWVEPCVAQTVSERYLLAAANQARAAEHLAPVHLDAGLARAALTHARVMAANHAISHRFPSEADLSERAGYAGARFSKVSENVGVAWNPAIIHDLWMQSPGHRANIMDPGVDSVGLAVIADHGAFYAVEDFAMAVEVLPLAVQEATVARLLEQRGVHVLPPSHFARETCALNQGFAGTRKPWYVMRYTTSDLSRLPEELTARMATGKYHEAGIGACEHDPRDPFSSFHLAVMLYP